MTIPIVAQSFINRNPGGIPVNHDGASVTPLDIISIGTGAAWMDANADGNLDLYVTMRTGNNLLYIGDGMGGFVESAVAYGAHDPTGDGAGVAIADFNNDGFQDIFLANAKGDRLLRNDGGTGFTDITAASGIDMTDQSRGTSASWADFNNDGYLDLYISNHSPMSGATNADTQDHLYKNNGNETFTDVSMLFFDAGDSTNIMGNGFIGGWLDYDLDGDQDLFVINDCVYPNYIPNKVFRNDGDTDTILSWKFTEVSNLLGVDSCANAMGLARGDFNRDGIIDYYFSNIGPAILFKGNGTGFEDVTAATGTNEQTYPLFSWGTCFFDADLDGWQDLFLILGSHHFPSGTDPHNNMFFLNNANGLDFTDRSTDFNLADSTRGRTVVAGDYDNDGDIDLALVNYGEEIVIKENNLVHQNHYLSIRLQGTISNRDGIGSRLSVKTPDGVKQWSQVYSGSSLGGGDQLNAHFGLGNNEKVDTLTIFWPSGTQQIVTNIAADQIIHVKEFDPLSPAAEFSDEAIAMGIDEQCGSCGLGNGVSFADFNGDGLDDISFGTQMGDSVLFYQNNGNGFDKLPSLVNCTEKTETVLWFDYDNDGDMDLLLTNFKTLNQGQNRLYRNDGNLNMVEITYTCGLLIQDDLSYGAIAGDYDKDGDLDFYIANWSASNMHTNYLYRNDGNDSFTEVSAAAGVADGFELTFCSAFFDYDNDGWPDLYNSQDRVQSSNSLFRNNGNGTFTDVSVSSNTDLAIDAMNVSIGDYDHDDNMDIYITNTTNPTQLPPHNAMMVNQGNGTFVESALDLGIAMYDVTWGANFVDVDLDNDLDLYVSAMHQTSSNSSDLFINQYPLDTFHVIEPPGMEGDTLNSFSNAIGDFNNDGLPDIVVNNGNPLGYINKFQLWRNNSNVSGHWLKIKLRGIESNRDGVGSKIEYFINGQKFIRYTQCGTGYLAQNSFTEMIGTGSTQTLDSLHVYWPGGFVSRLNNVRTGQTFDIYETDVLYVNKEATGEDSGLAWQDAFVHLEDALAFAEQHHVKEIWIRSGTYVPHLNDRTKSFVVPDGVHIYGGFAGNETDISQRNPALNPVTISGDIGVIDLDTDNSYHVISIGAGVKECVVDGLSIASGRADGMGTYLKRGAGVHCLGNASFTNVTISDCYSEERGAAIYASGWKAKIQVEQLTLQSNTSPLNRFMATDNLATIRMIGVNNISN